VATEDDQVTVFGGLEDFQCRDPLAKFGAAAYPRALGVLTDGFENNLPLAF
jgi:hypothetical protein